MWPRFRSLPWRRGSMSDARGSRPPGRSRSAERLPQLGQSTVRQPRAPRRRRCSGRPPPAGRSDAHGQQPSGGLIPAAVWSVWFLACVDIVAAAGCLYGRNNTNRSSQSWMMHSAGQTATTAARRPPQQASRPWERNGHASGSWWSGAVPSAAASNQGSLSPAGSPPAATATARTSTRRGAVVNMVAG